MEIRKKNILLVLCDEGDFDEKAPKRYLGVDSVDAFEMCRIFNMFGWS